MPPDFQRALTSVTTASGVYPRAFKVLVLGVEEEKRGTRGVLWEGIGGSGGYGERSRRGKWLGERNVLTGGHLGPQVGSRRIGKAPRVLDPSGRGYLDVLCREDGAKSPEECGVQYADA